MASHDASVLGRAIANVSRMQLLTVTWLSMDSRWKHAGRVIMFGVAFLASLAVAEFGEYGEQGVTDVDGNFIPGSSGIYSQKSLL